MGNEKYTGTQGILDGFQQHFEQLALSKEDVNFDAEHHKLNKYSFFPRTIPFWNSLPASIAEAPDLVSFKGELSTLTI